MLYRVLLKDTAGIPEERLHVLQDSVAGYYQVERHELTTESIQAAATIDPRSTAIIYSILLHATTVIILKGVKFRAIQILF